MDVFSFDEAYHAFWVFPEHGYYGRDKALSRAVEDWQSSGAAICTSFARIRERLETIAQHLSTESLTHRHKFSLSSHHSPSIRPVWTTSDVESTADATSAEIRLTTLAQKLYAELCCLKCDLQRLQGYGVRISMLSQEASMSESKPPEAWNSPDRHWWQASKEHASLHTNVAQALLSAATWKGNPSSEVLQPCSISTRCCKQHSLASWYEQIAAIAPFFRDRLELVCFADQ